MSFVCFSTTRRRDCRRSRHSHARSFTRKSDVTAPLGVQRRLSLTSTPPTVTSQAGCMDGITRRRCPRARGDGPRAGDAREGPRDGQPPADQVQDRKRCGDLGGDIGEEHDATPESGPTLSSCWRTCSSDSNRPSDGPEARGRDGIPSIALDPVRCASHQTIVYCDRVRARSGPPSTAQSLVALA